MTPLWEKRLLQQFQLSQGAPFYLIRASALDSAPRESLTDWYHNFLKSYLKLCLSIDEQSAEDKIELGHADILTIRKKEGQQTYKIEGNDLRELFTSQGFKNIELPQKIITVLDADDIPERYANKMLKTLEEPQEKSSIFFLASSQKPLLKTIESRALHLRIPNPSGQKPGQQKTLSPQNKRQWFLEKFEEHSGASSKHKKLVKNFLENPLVHIEMINAIRKEPAFAELVFQLMVEWNQREESSMEAKKDFLYELRWFQEAKTFHNAPLERYFGLIHQTFIKKY